MIFSPFHHSHVPKHIIIARYRTPIDTKEPQVGYTENTESQFRSPLRIFICRREFSTMTQLNELNAIAIAQICFYTPSLAVAVFLASRHGFGRNAGWLYLVIFSVARILGASLGLAASHNDPTNLGLSIGAATLQSIGLAPLVLVMLALVSRVLESIRYARDTFVTPRHLRFVQLVVIVALILGAVGGGSSAAV